MAVEEDTVVEVALDKTMKGGAAEEEVLRKEAAEKEAEEEEQVPSALLD